MGHLMEYLLVLISHLVWLLARLERGVRPLLGLAPRPELAPVAVSKLRRSVRQNDGTFPGSERAWMTEWDEPARRDSTAWTFTPQTFWPPDSPGS